MTLQYYCAPSLSAARIPSRLEPAGIYRSDGKRPYGITVSLGRVVSCWSGMPHAQTLLLHRTLPMQQGKRERLLPWQSRGKRLNTNIWIPHTVSFPSQWPPQSLRPSDTGFPEHPHTCGFFVLTQTHRRTHTQSLQFTHSSADQGPE